MKPKDISEARDPDLRASKVAIQRAALLARKVAIQTGTDLIIVQDGKLCRLRGDELRVENLEVRKDE
jgi:hypothetical protein